MNAIRNTSALTLLLGATWLASPASAQEIEEIVGQHMAAEALLAAHLVAVATKAGLSDEEVRAILVDVAERSVIDEFWITGPDGATQFSNQDVDFAFSPDPEEQPQGSAFWPLLTGDEQVVIQDAQKREIDDQIFKYVGVSGIDEPRIVQVGIAAEHIARSAD